MTWETIGRPGFFGEKRDLIYQEFNKKYGQNNWRIMWKWNNQIIPWIDACMIYEQAYYEDSKNREELWKKLAKTAKDVYDYDLSNIESKLIIYIKKERELIFKI
jgi:hypothetical protein